MRDEKLVADLFAECKVELGRLRHIMDRTRNETHPSYWPKNIPPIFECEERLLRLMERLAMGDSAEVATPTKTSWDKINNEETP